MQKQDDRRILTADWLLKITGISTVHKIRNDDLRQPLGIQITLLDKVVQQRL